MTDTSTTITRQLIAEDQRVNHTAELFGINFPLRLEPFVYGITDRIAEGYSGGYCAVEPSQFHRNIHNILGQKIFDIW